MFHFKFVADVCDVYIDLQTIQSARQCQAVESGFHQRSRTQNIKENGRHQWLTIQIIRLVTFC